MATDTIDYSGLPEDLRAGFKRYIEQRLPMGSFGSAVVQNDLRTACERADNRNRVFLWHIVFWLYNFAPSECWGSPKKVADWLERKDLQSWDRICEDCITPDERAKILRGLGDAIGAPR